MDTRNEIREFLTSRRAKITPEQAGLRTLRQRTRRVPGLRREEVALLAGVSVDYYTRLERGNASGASEAVLEALARALQLDEAERAHLFDLARAAQPTPRRRRRARRSGCGRGAAMLDAMTGGPAFVRNGRMDILAANRLGRALLLAALRQPAGPPNSARFIFLDDARAGLLRRLGTGGDRRGRRPALRGRPRPLRPRSLGPRRRALDAKRDLPHALGRTQRALPRERHQALPSSRRRRRSA